MKKALAVSLAALALFVLTLPLFPRHPPDPLELVRERAWLDKRIEHFRQGPGAEYYERKGDWQDCCQELNFAKADRMAARFRADAGRPSGFLEACVLLQEARDRFESINARTEEIQRPIRRLLKRRDAIGVTLRNLERDLRFVD